MAIIKLCLVCIIGFLFFSIESCSSKVRFAHIYLWKQAMMLSTRILSLWRVMRHLWVVTLGIIGMTHRWWCHWKNHPHR
jgi:hypothetical protein